MLEIPQIERTLSQMLSKLLKTFPEYEHLEITEDPTIHIKTSSLEVALAVTGSSFANDSMADFIGEMHSKYAVFLSKTHSNRSIDYFFTNQSISSSNITDALHQLDFKQLSDNSFTLTHSTIA